MIGDLGVLVPILGIIFGTTLVGFIFSKIVDLIKTWINRNNTSITEQDFDRLAKAFMEHKQNTNQRIQHLEAIIADKDLSYESDQIEQIEAHDDSIEIEDEDQRDSTADNDGNLRNMLHEQ